MEKIGTQCDLLIVGATLEALHLVTRLNEGVLEVRMTVYINIYQRLDEINGVRDGERWLMRVDVVQFNAQFD